MGGFGSGRPSTRRKVEDYRSLDVNKLHKTGLLENGRFTNWQWSQFGEQVASIRMVGEQNQLRLVYRARWFGDEWEDFDYAVPVEWVSCNLGGTRPYFLCPVIKLGLPCRRRVTKLLGGRTFACRHCHDLTYSSQSEDALGRAYRRREKRKLRITYPENPELIRRPRGMWERTYRRHLESYWQAEEEADELFAITVGRRFKLLG